MLVQPWNLGLPWSSLSRDAIAIFIKNLALQVKNNLRERNYTGPNVRAPNDDPLTL
jgi:hypothetical protein